MYGFGGRLSSLRRSCKDFSRLARKLDRGSQRSAQSQNVLDHPRRVRVRCTRRELDHNHQTRFVSSSQRTERVTHFHRHTARSPHFGETSALSSKPISPAHLPGAAGSVPSSELCRSHASPASAPGSRSAAMEQSDPRKPARHVRAAGRQTRLFTKWGGCVPPPLCEEGGDFRCLYMIRTFSWCCPHPPRDIHATTQM